ncbi:MAG: nitrilase-related carbon-nitrogen hydrolase [Desulfurococcaceae archaeon]
MSRIVIGIVQASFTAYPPENAEKAYSLVKRNYREADLIVLPEYSMTNPLQLRDPFKVYELSEYATSSRFLATFIRLANELGAGIVVHFIERTDVPPKSRSTVVLVTSRGEVLPVYSKMHLFDAYGYRESEFFEPGTSLGKIVSLNGFPIAFAVCYDLRFPELFRSYAVLGVNVFVVQAGWVKGPLKEEILDKLASARAHENTAYVVVANQTSEMFTGRSGVFSPWGYRELDMGISEKYSEHSIFLDEVEKARTTIPTIRQSFDKWEIKLKAPKVSSG